MISMQSKNGTHAFLLWPSTAAIKLFLFVDNKHKKYMLLCKAVRPLNSPTQTEI
jgi:hypothetical protein